MFVRVHLPWLLATGEPRDENVHRNFQPCSAIFLSRMTKLPHRNQIRTKRVCMSAILFRITTENSKQILVCGSRILANFEATERVFLVFLFFAFDVTKFLLVFFRTRVSSRCFRAKKKLAPGKLASQLAQKSVGYPRRSDSDKKKETGRNSTRNLLPIFEEKPSLKAHS